MQYVAKLAKFVCSSNAAKPSIRTQPRQLFAQNPLDMFPKNFPVDGEVANLLQQVIPWNLGNNMIQQTQRSFARANLLWTCYGFATGKLV